MLAASDAFTPSEIAIALELVDGGEPDGYLFHVAEIGGEVAGYACYGANPADEGSWDLYWIVVAPPQQRRGIGSALIAATEDSVARSGGRRVVVETSSQPSYAGARAFYERHGYLQIGRAAGFYGDADDKVVYSKEVS
jgi:putative acetyltransferase